MRHKLCFHLYLIKKLKLEDFHKVINCETPHIISKECSLEVRTEEPPLCRDTNFESALEVQIWTGIVLFKKT